VADGGNTGQFEALHRLQDRAIDAARSATPPQYSGDGIVMVAGGGRHFVNAYVSLALLRRDLKCHLPIQVWHLGPADMSPRMAKLLEQFDVEVIDASEVRRTHPMRIMGGWECKPYAVLHSRFERVILMDADNFARRDPAYLLEHQELDDSGALFWPDISVAPINSPQWELFRVPFRREPEFESGQLVIDKSRAWLPLNLAVHYCAWSDIYWQYVNGDKQAFQMAWRHLEAPYALCPWPVKHLTGVVETPIARQHWKVAFEQYDFDGAPLFHHRGGCEWVLYGTNIMVDGEGDIEAKCHVILGELRSLWDGRILPDPAAPAELDQSDPATVRWYRYRRTGIGERTIELLPGGEIGAGNGDIEQSWRIETKANGVELVIANPRFDVCSLAFNDDGVWRGRWNYFEQGPTELIPLADAGSSS